MTPIDPRKTKPEVLRFLSNQVEELLVAYFERPVGFVMIMRPDASRESFMMSEGFPHVEAVMETLRETIQKYSAGEILDRTPKQEDEADQ